tara:strand:- start:188 stop:409 length:222 start_codon:yes stop_codon:yes gene_type:complete
MKIFLSMTLLLFFSGCMQGTAFLGPAVTGASTGNAYQAGLSFGSSRVVKEMTGKSTIENIISILDTKEDSSNQ